MTILLSKGFLMAILSSLNLLSEQRLGVDDMRRIESASRNDWDTSVTSVLTGTGQGYIIRGFSIVANGAIGNQATALQMVVDPGAVLHISASVSGTIFQTPIGTSNQILNSSSNTNVIGSFTANATNYIGLDYSRTPDSSTNITKYIWSAASNSEIQTIAPAAQTLTFNIVISTAPWSANVLPIAIVVTDTNGNVTSLTDARYNFYSLETGGLNPNPTYTYPWSDGRTQPPITITASNISEDPFNGGDKQIDSMKSWMNAMMTSIQEVKGTPQWFTPLAPVSIQSLFQDLGNTVVTGQGEISNGILPNADAILVTTGTITSGSEQLTGLASTSGLTIGDYVFATGIPTGAKIANISGSTITLSIPATLNANPVTVSFYSPSVITSPGQINWDDPIQIRVIGSFLTYSIASNLNSTNITLSDDEVAYISLVRDVSIVPNLIFVNGTNTVVSVGNISWTSSLEVGDFIKLASDNYSGYYQIQELGTSANSYLDSAYAVTLTANFSEASTGSSGARSVYAYGNYITSASPVGNNRAIQIANRSSVPVNGDTFWLFIREDNTGNPRVYVRFLSQELDNGQSIAVSGTTSQELLQYIGSSSATQSAPQYVSAMNPGSLAQISTLTVGNGSTVTAGQYFFINSSGNYRTYYAWFTVNGVGTDPNPGFLKTGIAIGILSTDTVAQVAQKIANSLNNAPYPDFNAVAGATTVVVTNTSAGVANATVNFNVSAPFAVTTNQIGTGTGNYIIQDGNNLTLAIKEIDRAVGAFQLLLDEPNYDETVEILSSGATPPNSINGPITSGTTINLPNNSRMGNIQQNYTVGNGVLEVYWNGQLLTVGGGFTEVGPSGSISNSIVILVNLAVGDELQFRINVSGAQNGLQGAPGPAGTPGATGPAGMNSAGGPVAISIKTGNYTTLSGDCLIACDCTSGPITITMLTATGNTGRIFYIKKIDTTSNPVTIVGSGSDVIEFGSLPSLTARGMSVSLISNGSTGYWAF